MSAFVVKPLNIIPRYNEYYYNELIESYLSNEINLEELISKLDYNQVHEQSELFNFLNLLITNKFQRRCYNECCNKLIYFSDAFKYARIFQNYALKDFIKIWIGSNQLGKKNRYQISVEFYCCEWFKKTFNLTQTPE